jgi:ribosomal protein S18 acetylase RimI-like enzyme
MIETLDSTSRPEVVEVFSAAFNGHPLMPPDPTGRRSRLLATSILSAFAAAPDARLFGIRRNGRLDCAAFVYEDGYEPRGFTLVLLLIRMVRVLGWRMSHKFGEVMSQKSSDRQRRLELMLLGTRDDCQGQGLGRAMIHHIFEFARNQGYQSVVLEVPKETPAFGFYLREGFLVEKEIALPTMPLCLLRRPLTEN